MPTENILDARDRFPGPDVPIAIPMDPHDVVDLARLRAMERDLSRPVLELLAELVLLRRLAAVTRPAAEKVAAHKRTGWKHIKVGAFDEVLEALGLQP
jgi:hypothetical protein